MGLRAKLESLQAHLDTGCIVTAYLDDIQILSKEPIIQDAMSFFHATPHDGIQLNPYKCRSINLHESATKLLGSYIGTDPATFIKPEVDLILQALPKVNTLLSQHALLLLRFSIQHKLRHLLRTLPPTTQVLEVWQPLDTALRQAVL